MWRWVIGVATLVVVTLMAGYVVMNARTFQLAGELVSRVDTTDKVVALTFDDGPSAHAPEVLDMLAAAKVPATFYLNGADLDRYPAQGRAIAEAGHDIGNHTYTHRRMVLVSPTTVADEIERTDAAIARTGYQGPVTFRPPFCKKLWTLPRYLAEHDRVSITWDVEPDSAGNPDTATIVDETVRSVRPGSIILLHVMADSRAPSRAAVPQIIERLRADGYDFVTVSELLGPMNVQGLPPIVGGAPTVLFLGNAPSVLSLAHQQYYGNPRNAFWTITGALYGFSSSAPYPERISALIQHGVAVWDVLRFCRRAGSLDSAVEPDSMVANDFGTFYREYPTITRVYFTGGAAEANYRRLVGFDDARQFIRLPSTSPAHTMPVAQKLAAWREALQ